MLAVFESGVIETNDRGNWDDNYAWVSVNVMENSSTIGIIVVSYCHKNGMADGNRS